MLHLQYWYKQYPKKDDRLLNYKSAEYMDWLLQQYLNRKDKLSPPDHRPLSPRKSKKDYCER